MRPAFPLLRRVLMTADTMGGVWTYALELAQALHARGVEVALATMGHPPTREQREELQAVAGVQLYESSYKLEWMDDPWGDIAAAGEWLLELEQRLQPDLIHLNGFTHGALPWQAPKIVVGHSCVFSWWRAVHGQLPPAEWNRYRDAVTAGLQSAELVVAPSRAMLASLAEFYGPFAASTVIPNGRRLYFPRQAQKQKFVLAAGRLWDQAKNIAALERIASALPWPVCVAGEAHHPGGAERRHSGVQHLGRLSARELPAWFARASIYALPALYEPFGLSAVEAALAGCALVLGDIPTLREIWGEAAVFVPPDSPDALREALLELMEQPLRLQRFASKARETVARYTPERMAGGYLFAYRTCLRRRSGAHTAMGQGLRPAARTQLTSPSTLPSSHAARPL